MEPLRDIAVESNVARDSLRRLNLLQQEIDRKNKEYRAESQRLLEGIINPILPKNSPMQNYIPPPV